MKTMRKVLLGTLLAAGLASGVYAHEPRVGLSINLGYPVVVAPAPVYYAPPAVVYAPPQRVYLPQSYVVSPYGYRVNAYGYDYRPHRGWHRHGHKHHHHR